MRSFKNVNPTLCDVVEFEDDQYPDGIDRFWYRWCVCLARHFLVKELKITTSNNVKTHRLYLMDRIDKAVNCACLYFVPCQNPYRFVVPFAEAHHEKGFKFFPDSVMPASLFNIFHRVRSLPQPEDYDSELHPFVFEYQKDQRSCVDFRLNYTNSIGRFDKSQKVIPCDDAVTRGLIGLGEISLDSDFEDPEHVLKRLEKHNKNDPGNTPEGEVFRIVSDSLATADVIKPVLILSSLSSASKQSCSTCVTPTQQSSNRIDIHTSSTESTLYLPGGQQDCEFFVLFDNLSVPIFDNFPGGLNFVRASSVNGQEVLGMMVIVYFKVSAAMEAAVLADRRKSCPDYTNPCKRAFCASDFLLTKTWFEQNNFRYGELEVPVDGSVYLPPGYGFFIACSGSGAISCKYQATDAELERILTTEIDDYLHSPSCTSEKDGAREVMSKYSAFS